MPGRRQLSRSPSIARIIAWCMLRTCSSVKYTTNAITPQVLQAHLDSAQWPRAASSQIHLRVCLRVPFFFGLSVLLFDEFPVCTALKTVIFGESFGVALVERLIVE